MRYHDITYDDMRNGDGLRVTLWVSGCDHRCLNCQNKITWDPDDGLIFDDKAQEELMNALSKDYILGLTISGGDPLFQTNIDEVTALCKKVKLTFPEKNIWLYTGSLYEEISNMQVMDYIDICVDGEYIDAQKDIKLKWRGSSNQRVIDVKKTKASNQIMLHCD